MRSCRPCPDENHISPPGSTSVEQCQCPRGYIPSEGDGGRTCQLLACPKLDPPANGYFVKQSCNSVFNGACGIRCNGGYKLVGSSIRLCQENGTWSGEEATCQVRRNHTSHQILYTVISIVLIFTDAQLQHRPCPKERTHRMHLQRLRHRQRVHFLLRRRFHPGWVSQKGLSTHWILGWPSRLLQT